MHICNGATNHIHQILNYQESLEIAPYTDHGQCVYFNDIYPIRGYQQPNSLFQDVSVLAYCVKQHT